MSILAFLVARHCALYCDLLSSIILFFAQLANKLIMEPGQMTSASTSYIKHL